MFKKTDNSLKEWHERGRRNFRSTWDIIGFSFQLPASTVMLQRVLQECLQPMAAKRSGRCSSSFPFASGNRHWICVALAIDFSGISEFLQRLCSGKCSFSIAEEQELISLQVPHGHCWWLPCLLEPVMGWKMGWVGDVLVRICLCHPFSWQVYGSQNMVEDVPTERGFYFYSQHRVEEGSICREQVLGLISSRFSLETRKAKCARWLKFRILSVFSEKKKFLGVKCISAYHLK